MIKTGQQIEDDIYALLKNSDLAATVSGNVYKFGMRPYNSTSEDIIVKFITALTNEIQTGTVVVNIYVPDIDAYDNGSLIRNISRCKTIEQKSNEWVASLTADKTEYLFELSQAIYTEEEPELNQHFISIRLKFKVLTI
jgi:hypothetical protein